MQLRAPSNLAQVLLWMALCGGSFALFSRSWQLTNEFATAGAFLACSICVAALIGSFFRRAVDGLYVGLWMGLALIACLTVTAGLWPR